MKTFARRAVRGWLAGICLAMVALCVSPRAAQAESIIKRPGDHARYAVELEPHANLGLLGYYGVGLGLGGRVGIPLVHNGFVSTINNSIAISAGADFVHYTGCWYTSEGCGVNYLFVPVVMQWNFYLTRQWSVFGEPGLAIYHAFFDDICGGFAGCVTPTATSVAPVFEVGGRFHFADTFALTMRVGYPTASVGLSIFL